MEWNLQTNNETLGCSCTACGRIQNLPRLHFFAALVSVSRRETGTICGQNWLSVSPLRPTELSDAGVSWSRGKARQKNTWNDSRGIDLKQEEEEKEADTECDSSCLADLRGSGSI